MKTLTIISIIAVILLISQLRPLEKEHNNADIPTYITHHWSCEAKGIDKSGYLSYRNCTYTDSPIVLEAGATIDGLIVIGMGMGKFVAPDRQYLPKVSRW